MDAGGLGLGLGTGGGLGLNLDPLAAAAAAKEEQEQENGTSFFDLDDDADSSEMEEGDSKYGGDEMLLPGSAVASDLGHGLAAGGNATKQRARATSLLEATARHHPRFAAAAAGGSATAAGAGIITAETNHATVSAQGLKEGTRVFEWVGAHVIKLVECESAASGSTTAGAVRDRVVAVFTRDVKDSKGAGELEMDSEVRCGPLYTKITLCSSLLTSTVPRHGSAHSYAFARLGLAYPREPQVRRLMDRRSCCRAQHNHPVALPCTCIAR